jgi:hypothetical protein
MSPMLVSDIADEDSYTYPGSIVELVLACTFVQYDVMSEENQITLWALSQGWPRGYVSLIRSDGSV